MTSGFYKLDSELLFAPNGVLAPGYQLFKEDAAQYTYPVDGWHWFDNEEAAREFFNLPAATTQIESTQI